MQAKRPACAKALRLDHSGFGGQPEPALRGPQKRDGEKDQRSHMRPNLYYLLRFWSNAVYVMLIWSPKLQENSHIHTEEP